MLRKTLISCLLVASQLALNPIALAQERFIIVASTTSTQDSGLFKHLLPIFKTKTGIDVRVVAQGTGQALATAQRGDADVVFVHDTVAELKFVADGFGVDRRDVMYNDFILLGPKSDSANIKGKKDVAEAFKTIAQSRSTFVSRGDKSGTHAAELRHWNQANVDVAQGKGTWYKEAGSGMGPTLNTASGLNAYTFSDRATWISFKNRGDLKILVEGDSKLFNQYGIILVNPQKHPHIKKELGQQFIDWITSAEGQNTIASYKLEGQSLFFSNFKK
jgi:tungstate transport system substrate-binding protein